MVAFTFVDGAEGGVDAAAVVEGTWVRLGAEGLSFALDAWYDVRIAVHDIGEGRYVGFFIRQPAGDVQLTGSDGAKWFPVDKSHLGAVREVSLVGRCGFGDWSVARGADTADALIQTWIGGTNGDWNVAANWSAGRVPEAGELVGVLQHVTLSRAGERAEVSNAVLRVTAEGGLALEAGAILTPVEVDVSRPRVGKALSVQVAPFGGIVPSLDVVWTRYQSARGALVEICREGGLIDQYFTRLRRPAEANERLWFYRYGFSGGIYGTGDHPGLKAFFQARLKWLDRQFHDVPTLMASLREGTKSISTVFPLPYVDQSCPYVASPKVLPLAFANAPEGGVPKGRNLRLSFPVGGNVATVGVYVNGPKVGAPVKPDHGRIDMVIPSSALTAAVGEPNCISLVAFDTAGRPIARNYALVWSRPGEGGVIFLR